MIKYHEIDRLYLIWIYTCTYFINVDIIRVGSRSKNEALEECNLRKQRGWKSKQLHRAHLELRAKREKFIVSSATFHSKILPWYGIFYTEKCHIVLLWKCGFQTTGYLHIKQAELAFDMCFFSYCTLTQSRSSLFSSKLLSYAQAYTRRNSISLTIFRMKISSKDWSHTWSCLGLRSSSMTQEVYSTAVMLSINRFVNMPTG